MGLFDFFRRKPPPPPPPSPAAAADVALPSIFDWLSARLAETPDGLPDSSVTLPAEAADAEPDALRFAAGARDGIATHHMAATAADDEVAQMFRLVAAYSRTPSERAASLVEAYATERQIVAMIDPLLERLPRSEVEASRLRDLALRLATGSPHVEPAKLGLAFLGVIGGPPDEEPIRVLGSHDEFALFAGVAAGSRGGDAELLWRMARRVSGWGRIHLVERLVQLPELSAEIRGWLVRDGFENAVMNEYLALACAQAGRLAESLAADRVPPATLARHARLLAALLAPGGPAGGIESYEDAADALERFIAHVERSPDVELRVRAIVPAIVAAADRGDLDVAENGWTLIRRDALVARCEQILSGPETRAAVERGLASSDNETFGHADELAGHLGIDRWPARWELLKRSPTDPYAMFLVSESVDETHLESFLAHVRRVAPPGAIATGPTTSNGLGPGWATHSLFESALQSLDRFPGRGEDLVIAALRSPIIRHRGRATVLLSKFAEASAEAMAALREAARAEPHDETRRQMTNVIEGRPIDRE